MPILTGCQMYCVCPLLLCGRIWLKALADDLVHSRIAHGTQPLHASSEAEGPMALALASKVQALALASKVQALALALASKVQALASKVQALALALRVEALALALKFWP